jgi:hypothetical protein
MLTCANCGEQNPERALAAADRIGDRGLAAHATLGRLELRLDSPDRGPARYRTDVQQVLSLLESLGDEEGQSRAWRLLGLAVRDDLYAQARELLR